MTKYFARLEDALLNRALGNVVCLTHMKSTDDGYKAVPVDSLYPVPAVTGVVTVWPECVCLEPADEMLSEPYVTWWREEFASPLPSDHGKVSQEYNVFNTARYDY